MKALAARPRYLADQRFEALLMAGQFDQAELLIRQAQIGDLLARIGPALIAGRRGDFQHALALLPSQAAITRDKDVPTAVVRGDALRSLGQERAALDLLGARFVDDANPVAWAWEWLAPAPTRAINVGGSLDLGYIVGCYLGEGDPEAGGNFRWCSDGAQLRFPGAGRMAPQTLTLRVDGRAWHSYRSDVAPAQVLLGQQQIGTFAADTSSVEQFSFALPPTPDGSELVITIRTPTFVPDAARYNSQQGRGVVGQVHRLGVRIDEVRVAP